MKNILRLSLLFICLIVMVGCGKKDDNKLVMVTEAGFAPYEYYENGEIVGVDVDIAKEIAQNRGIEKMSAQAVGGAVGWNPICIIVPCHRVVGTNGSLTGYGGGIQNKVKLLEIENNDMSKFTIPKKGTAL